ncbi:MAG: hypothetical protein ACKV19_20620 [Verrucomicrobiales bacterium]
MIHAQTILFALDRHLDRPVSLQVILRPNWQDQLVPIHLPALHHLRLSRPHVLDLLLTKMMRGADPQDMADAAFLLTQPEAKREGLPQLFAQARVPDVPEIHALFAEAQPIVLGLAESAEPQQGPSERHRG